MTFDSEALIAGVVRQAARHPEDVDKIATDRWVRVMCDFSADGVWDREGCDASPDDLPISTALIARIYAWQDDFETLDPMDGPADPEHFAQFVDEGFQIAIEMKIQLPDWTIIYHDSGRAQKLPKTILGGFKNSIDPYRTWFEYEITDAVVQSAQKPHTSLAQPVW